MLSNKVYETECQDCGNVETTKDYGNDCSKCDGFVKIISKQGKCHCGRIIEFSNFTNTCDCGRDYNSSGQELAPREQWGEETGESLSDILSIK